MNDYLEGERFVHNLCFLRKKYGVPQKSLAALAGISLPILRLTERGQVVPRLTQEQLTRLCQIFNITPNALLQTDLTK